MREAFANRRPLGARGNRHTPRSWARRTAGILSLTFDPLVVRGFGIGGRVAEGTRLESAIAEQESQTLRQ
jgi:hypothetical protein